MSDVAKLILPDDKTIELPVYKGTENEKCVDITKLPNFGVWKKLAGN